MTKRREEFVTRPHGLTLGEKLGPIICPKCKRVIHPGRLFKVVEGVRYHKDCRK